MKRQLNDFANDTDAGLTAYVQMYRTRIADMTHEIEDKVRGTIDECAVAAYFGKRGTR